MQNVKVIALPDRKLRKIFYCEKRELQKRKNCVFVIVGMILHLS